MDNIYHRDHAPTMVSELDEMTLFIRKIYYYGLGFMATTVIAWLVLMAVKWHPHQYLPFPTYVLPITIFMVMVLLNCIPQMAYCSPCKWLLALIVVVCTTVGGCVLIDMVGSGIACLVMLVVALIILVLNFSGSKCPQEFLPGGVFSTMLMILLLVTMVIVGIAQLITGNAVLLDIFVSILFIMVIIAILIQAQFNHNRLTVVEVSPKHHQIICILTLYLHTMMFLFCIYYFIAVETESKLASSLTTLDDSGYYT